MVESISRVGLKRPITVAARKGNEPEEYDRLRPGRLEAFIELGQREIPAVIINAEENDCMGHEPRGELRQTTAPTN